jgi:hypothetical protein
MNAISYHSQTKKIKIWSEIIVLMFVFFNAFLCFLMSFVSGINANTVIIFQFILFLGSIIIVWINKTYFVDWLLLGCLFTGITLSYFIDGNHSLKIFFDVLVIPISFMIGRNTSIDIWKIIKIVFWINLCFLIIEFVFPDLFVQLFPVGKYYSATREWVEIQNVDSSFYVGSTRPGEGNFLSNHRHASLMLDPLTFSYLMILVGIAARVYAKNKKEFLLYWSLSFFAILLSDTRTSLMILVLLSIIPINRFILKFNLLFVFLVVWISVFMVWVSIDLSISDFYLRLSYTFDGISKNDTMALLGFGRIVGVINDSGYLYLLDILGLPLLLCLIMYFDWYRKKTGNAYQAFVLLSFFLFLLITLFFGEASLSGKTIVVWGIYAGSTVAVGSKSIVGGNPAKK